MTAKQIQALRKKSGLTQKEFAARLKVDTITVSRWERGANRPDITSVRRMERLARNLAAA